MATGPHPLSWEALHAARLKEPLGAVEWVTEAIGLATRPYISERLEARLLSRNASGSASGERRVATISTALREQFAASLALIVEDRAAARSKLVFEVSLGLRDVLTLPAIMVKKRGRILLVHQVVCSDVRAAMYYAIWLLLDEDLKLGARLRRCPSCNGFFLKSPSLRRYCSREHMKAADKIASVERVAASRAGVSIDQWRARQSRRKRT